MNLFTCKDLIAMGRHIPTPFSINVTSDNGAMRLRIESILRVVPGKRLVALAKWNDDIVIAKLFYRRGHWKQSMLRDLRGITLLRQAAIPTPKVINQAFTADKQGAVLLIDFLQHSTGLRKLYDAASSGEEQHALIDMGIEATARCHQSGLWQKDIHLDNFLLSKGRVFVLDGGDIKGDGNPLDAGTCLQNLAVFLAQFPPAMDANLARFLQQYQKFADTLSGTDVSVIEKELRNKVIAARRDRLRKYERKLFRSTTGHRRVQSIKRFAVYDRSLQSELMERVISDPDSLLANGKMLKEGNSSTVALIELAGRNYVLKRYNIKSIFHGLKRLLQPSRASRSWRNAAVLEMLGIATPHGFLMIEERVLWVLRRRAWYLSEFVDSQNLLEQVASDSDNTLPVTPIVEKFKHLFHVLQDYYISHGDMKASNFIFKDEQLYVLDLDAMHRHSTLRGAQDLLNKDRERFRRNWGGTRFQPAVQHMLGELEPVSARQI